MVEHPLVKALVSFFNMTGIIWLMCNMNSYKMIEIKLFTIFQRQRLSLVRTRLNSTPDPSAVPSNSRT